MNLLGRRIVEHLARSRTPLDDDELAEALRVQRQVVNETCRVLEREGYVVRGVINGTKMVNSLRQQGEIEGIGDEPLSEPGEPESSAKVPAKAPEPAAVPTSAPVPAKVPAPAASSPIVAGNETDFYNHARRVLSARWGTALQRRAVALPGGASQSLGLVSGNGRIVGEVVWLEGLPSPEIKSSVVAENVWLIGHVTSAQRRFLVFGHDWDVLSRWLARYRPLVAGVELWYLDGDRLERLA